MKLSLKCDYDFNFNGDKSDKYVAFIFVFLMYSAVIALASCIFTNNLTREWKNSLNGHVTIEFQTYSGSGEKMTQNQEQEALDVIKTFPGVKMVRKLRDADILKILEPWLAGTAIPDDFPFPVIFDVETVNSNNADLLLLSDQLSKIFQGVKIHNHANWYIPIMDISNMLFVFAILLTILVCVTVCATVIFITRKTLNSYKDVVKMLQLIGATDDYIAAQFKKYYFLLSCKSSVVSIILCGITIFSINYVVFTQILSKTSLQYFGIAILVPIFIIMLIMITSKRTVLFFLKNDKWLS